MVFAKLIEKYVRLLTQRTFDAIELTYVAVVALVPLVVLLEATTVGVIVTAVSAAALVNDHRIQIVDVVLQRSRRLGGATILIYGSRHVVLQVEFLGIRNDVGVLLAEYIAHKVDHEDARRCLDGPGLLSGDLLIAAAALVLVGEAPSP